MQQSAGQNFDRSAGARGTGRRPLSRLPVIDVRAFTEGSLADRVAVAKDIRDACINIGFFYITGHRFSAAELEETLEYGRRFFALPLERKMRIAAKDSAANLGFIQVGGLNPSADAVRHADQKERLYLTRELAIGEVLDELNPAGKSQYPSEADLPGFAQALKASTGKKVKLAQALARAFSLSLDLPEAYLADYHDRMSCIHTFNYYPPLDPDIADKLWGFSPHTDYGTFTILQQDDSGGLQACNAAGDWIDVPPISGTFVVNVGNSLARWSNDVYVSTLHRVMNRGRDPRLSLSFFATPNPRAIIDVLPTCTDDRRPPRYDAVVAGEYIKQLLAQVYATGKPGISTSTAKQIGDG